MQEDTLLICRKTGKTGKTVIRIILTLNDYCFHTFYLKRYRTEKNVTKKCSSNINKLLLQRLKNRPEMKAFLFNNILGTVADNLGALIEFTLMYKTKVLSYHLKLKIANISWEQMVTIRQL